MTENEEEEFNRMMAILVKELVVWYCDQHFSHMNADERGEVERLIPDGDVYDAMASVIISLNLMMVGNALPGRVPACSCCDSV